MSWTPGQGTYLKSVSRAIIMQGFVLPATLLQSKAPGHELLTDRRTKDERTNGWTNGKLNSYIAPRYKQVR